MGNFNKVWANKVSKEQFIKQHSHIAGDMGAIWESLQDEKPKKEKSAEKPEKSS